jgi:hypothetical protein
MEYYIYILAGLATIILFFYTVGKDLLLYFRPKAKNPILPAPSDNIEYKETAKTVNLNYPEQSGLRDKWESEGYKIRWISPRNVETRKLNGYEILYVIDDATNERFSFQILDSNGVVELVLMGTKNITDPS